MRQNFFDIAFTPSVRAEQVRQGSSAFYPEPNGAVAGEFAEAGLTRRESAFLEARDSFYIASVSETGWPYVQHRGGPSGFLRVLDETTLGWAEFAGNRQYVTIGNTTGNDRVALFCMDYPNRRRLKVLGHLSAFAAAERPDLADLLSPIGYRGRVERLVLVNVRAFDWNCPQHITPRFTLAEAELLIPALRSGHETA